MRKVLVLSIFFSSLLFAKEGDPGGWGKAKWGMTESQVAKAFGGTIPTETDIGSFKYSVRFLYDANGKLERVMLKASEDSSVSVCYEDVTTRLKAKYGKPETEDSNLDNIKNQKGNAVWSFKKSKILVKMAHNIFGGDTIKFMYITYQKAGIVEKGSNNL